MKQHWKNILDKVDSMSLRERVLIFAAAAFLLVWLIETSFLEPLLTQQKKLSAQMSQQQQDMKLIQKQVEATVKAKNDIEHSPTKIRLSEAKQQLADSNVFLKGYRERLVEPGKMAQLLQQVLNKNNRLQLVNLKTLPVTPLLEKKKSIKPIFSILKNAPELDKQVFKHGVELTIRGNYLDILKYLKSIENLPTQMFWGKAEMHVDRHPTVSLTLTLYTLSLDETWLTI
ncbi:MAG: agglutinin biogenesis protein [Gallionellaceae bacterium]